MSMGGKWSSSPDPLAFLGEKIDEEVLAEVVGWCRKPVRVDWRPPGQTDEVGVLPEHEDVQPMPLAAHS
jgi:hypothetical protein